jgi:hypothetical protein
VAGPNRVKLGVTSAEASMIGTVHLRDRCQRSRHRRHIGHREIGVPEIEGNERSKVSKSRNRDHPSEGQVSEIGTSRHIANRDIGDQRCTIVSRNR